MRRIVLISAALLAAAGAAVAGLADSSGVGLTGVPTANPHTPGYSPSSRLSPELTQIVVAQGSTKLENPSALTSTYGYYNDVVNAAGDPQMVPTAASATEALKSEPDKNTYLVFGHGLKGADAGYDYGNEYLFQGHEVGPSGASYLTRINLDADAQHRVTLLATTDKDGHPISTVDGSTWDPWAKRLLLTTENASAPTYSATPDFPSTVEDISGALGRGGYEGIQNDSDGNIWIVEDIGGSTKPDPAGPPAPNTTAKIPHSYVYRYVPKHPGDLQNGKLQVLQVLNAANKPITEASQTVLNSPDQLALHTYGKTFKTQWITVHDTAVDGTTAFNANTLAKAKSGTPFKRPENGLFRPGSDFHEFYFDETGDTNATSPENATAGGWTSVWKLTQTGPSAASGQLTIVYKGDQAHAGFDNLAWLSRNQIAFVEDAGDGLHDQRQALDSGWVLDVTKDYSKPENQPIRWLAEGRDPSATLDSGASPSGFGKNEGDNEITGAHVSDGDPRVSGILGAKIPNLGDGDWRWFYTQQHGDNFTYEVVVTHHHGDHGFGN